MLWEIEIRPRWHDPERNRVCEEYDLLTHAGHGGNLATLRGPFLLPPGDKVIAGTARGYLFQGNLTPEQVERLSRELLVDPLAETARALGENAEEQIPCGGPATVLLKPGVMDPAAMSVQSAARDLGIALDAVYS